MVSGDVSFEEARWALYEAALSGAHGSPAAAMEAHKVQFAAAVATHARLLQGVGVQVRGAFSTLLTLRSTSAAFRILEQHSSPTARRYQPTQAYIRPYACACVTRGGVYGGTRAGSSGEAEWR